MHLMYKKAKAKGVRIDRADLVAQGRQVEFYPGVEDWFDAVAGYVKSHAQSHGVQLRHYLVSSGLMEIVEGTSIYKRFHNVFASEYWFDPYDLPFPKRVITDTGKTQYLFRINKGVEDLGESINQHMAEDARPIPFANMIYFGDGDTDVPSMAVMRKNGGHAVAVYPPGKSKGSASSCSGPAAAISSHPPTTGRARNCSGARACSSTASWRTSGCRRSGGASAAACAGPGRPCTGRGQARRSCSGRRSAQWRRAPAKL